MGEDLGTQKGPLIGKDLFHKHILPRQQRFFDAAKAYKLPVMLHTCGSSSWSYEDYIKAGVRAVDTLQPEATDMSPEHLKSHFADRLAFHGCISTTGNLAFGTPEDVRQEVKTVLGIMMDGAHYFLSPTHQIQDNSPAENVLAMYEAGRAYGRY
jgi:uroporphyrinogen decarboxylase